MPASANRANAHHFRTNWKAPKTMGQSSGILRKESLRPRNAASKGTHLLSRICLKGSQILMNI